MAHTNSTPNYNLPQFLPTDKPAWLVDVNPAYASIDTAIKNASDAAGSAQTDATQALSDAAGAQATATQANTKADGAIASLAESFLDTATYAIGEYVTFNNILYVCTEPITTPGPWTGSVNWTRASVDSIATALNNKTGADIPVSSSNLTKIATAIENLQVESGNNYIKFPDGTLICYGSITAGAGQYAPFGSMYYIDIELNIAFPVPFISAPTIVATTNSQTGQHVSHIIAYPTRLAEISIIRQNATGYDETYGYVAIGRWK